MLCDILIHLALNHNRIVNANVIIAIFFSLYVRPNAEIQVNNNTAVETAANMNQFVHGHYLHMLGYVNHIQTFLPYLSELKRQIFKFKSVYISDVKQKLETYGYKTKFLTLISIHIRMGDYENLLHGMPEAATEDYFTRAMQYFVSKYPVRFFL